MLALLPWFVILKLQMKTKEKIAVALAMSLGILLVLSLLLGSYPYEEQCRSDRSRQNNVLGQPVEEDRFYQ